MASLPLKINNNWVDVAEYASKHKGGRWLLEYARGKDVTFLFNAIHVMNPASAHAALSILPRVDEPPAVRDRVFSFSKPPKIRAESPEVESEFRAELHDMIRRRFDGDAAKTKATPAHWVRTTLLFALTAKCWLDWARGDVAAAVVLPFAHWLLAAHTCHDATHGALSTNPTLNYWMQFTAHPFFFNVFVWIPQHMLSHHQFTNDLDDVDLHHFAPATLSTKVDDYGGGYKNGRAWTFLFKGCLTTVGTCLLQPCRTIFDWKTPNFDENITPVPEVVSKATIALSTLPSFATLLWPLLFHDDGATLISIAFLTLWPWVGSSLVWTTMTQTSHVQAACQDQDAGCWTARQIGASLDYSVHDAREHALVSMLTGGLNAQALHHAVPTISQCHLAGIYDEYVHICEKHNVSRSTSRDIGTAAADCVDFVFANNKS
ncbi:hypothetical protein CTAYLR_009741 [Chrysophaeum taylorii]|uniref:Fatty acid desaturase domain-containing protein n=1 Tax=Chrysophaeum taylorii TaxID=2483200 RepID=A0AAD7XLY1_9STRA|nr:hypothetical protein CTAYLR_009741 [Chrysophaeum taylorii]